MKLWALASGWVSAICPFEVAELEPLRGVTLMFKFGGSQFERYDEKTAGWSNRGDL